MPPKKKVADKRENVVEVVLTPEQDAFIEDVIARENSKRPDPSTWLTKDAYVNMIVRDWYIQMVLPRVQADAANRFAQEFSKRYADFLKESGTVVQ